VTNRSSPTSGPGPELVRELLPVGPVALRAAVFNGWRWDIAAEFAVEVHQLSAGEFAAGALLENVIAAAGVEFRTGRVQREEDLFARLVAGVLIAWRMTSMAPRAVEFWREPAFVADRGGQAFFFNTALSA